MSGTVNKVTLIGHLGKDPDIRTTQSGGCIASFSIATSESWKDKQTGERKENTQWHRIVVFNEGLARFVERWLKKGMKIYLEGQLETRKWTSDTGQEHYVTEVVLRPYHGELTILEKLNQDGAASTSSQQTHNQQPEKPDLGGYYGTDGRFIPSSPSPQSMDLDDDIPF